MRAEGHEGDPGQVVGLDPEQQSRNPGRRADFPSESVGMAGPKIERRSPTRTRSVTSNVFERRARPLDRGSIAPGRRPEPRATTPNGRWSRMDLWVPRPHHAWESTATFALSTAETRQRRDEKYQRQWRPSRTGHTRQASTGFEDVTVFYNDGNVGPDDLAVEGVRANWTPIRPSTVRGTLVGADEFEKDGDRIPCSGQPEDHATEWVDGAVRLRRHDGRTDPHRDPVRCRWQLRVGARRGERHDRNQNRDLAGSEQVPCDVPTSPIRAIPVDPTVTGPDCTTAGTVVLPPSTVGYDWVKQARRHLRGGRRPGLLPRPGRADLRSW